MIHGSRRPALPNADIAVHRSDGSGTSFVWTDYLSKIGPQWKTSVDAGTTVPWPVGVGAEHNDGIATMQNDSDGAVGQSNIVSLLSNAPQNQENDNDKKYQP